MRVGRPAPRPAAPNVNAPPPQQVAPGQMVRPRMALPTVPPPPPPYPGPPPPYPGNVVTQQHQQQNIQQQQQPHQVSQLWSLWAHNGFYWLSCQNYVGKLACLSACDYFCSLITPLCWLSWVFLLSCLVLGVFLMVFKLLFCGLVVFIAAEVKGGQLESIQSRKCWLDFRTTYPREIKKIDVCT